jgi:hypothetical protein
MQQELLISRLSAKSIYQLSLVAFIFSIVPFCIVMGVFAVFGADTVKWNGEAIVGIKGLIASPFLGFFIAVVFTGLFGTLSLFGLWLYSKFKPLKIYFYPANESEKI